MPCLQKNAWPGRTELTSSSKPLKWPRLEPNLQVSFYYRLGTLRELYLDEALSTTIARLDIAELDHQLVQYISPAHLARVASFGLRGEVFFPVPYVLEANPFLVGYYRLLLGLSQKEIYNKGRLGRFKRLEETGEIPKTLQPELSGFCTTLIHASQALVDGIDDLSLGIVHDLQLLTIGPQFRGSENTRLGRGATKEFFDLVQSIVAPYVKETTAHTILLENDSKRPVLIEFSADPDVRISQKLESKTRPIVSIEIKGGTDVSNVHNRLGEAEKSHQKARNMGYFEFWTITRVDVPSDIARRESPTTSRFFHLDRIIDRHFAEHKEFREVLGSLLGIRT